MDVKRLFVIGDIHGAHKALMQCFKEANFDYENDGLISLGDICDGWPETQKCIDEMMKIKNHIFILGNHDEWTLKWMTEPREPSWDTQGGRGTFHSYIPKSHIDFLKSASLWEVIGEKLFVHGGIDVNQPDIKKQTKETCLWDRRLFATARKYHDQKKYKKWAGFEEIYIGHTSLSWIGYKKPTKFCNVWAMDTGAGWEGYLSMMNVETKEVFQSERVQDLYPGLHSRDMM